MRFSFRHSYTQFVLFLMCAVYLTPSYAQVESPEEIFDDLFVEVQMQKVFKDYKTFVDCTPRYPAETIMTTYHAQKGSPDFDLRQFVVSNFKLPDTNYVKYQSDTSVHIVKHIDSLWTLLTRKADPNVNNSSLIALPHPYVIPGGRFREVFYWDSYFIMLGLDVSKKDELLQNMIDNFTYLIDRIGFIPNGNRTYFLSRSQPPFYASMIDLLAKRDAHILVKYIPYLEKEYHFWMEGTEKLTSSNPSYKRVVRMKDGEILSRYWDDKTTPRPEAYGKEIVYSKNFDAERSKLMYRDIRAACESGWDFSTRWFKDVATMQTIHTTDIIPVDLNCLLYFYEETISKAYKLKGEEEKKAFYSNLAEKRKAAILKYCWDKDRNFFMDFDFVEDRTTPAYTLAASFPLYFHIATPEQAQHVAKKLEDSFLKKGGFVTTLHPSSFQWDSPNGWAPLQWTTIKGLYDYKHTDLAIKGAKRWLDLNERVYKNAGKLIEKYNVVEMNHETGGGEYALQDGFGWTNGVYLKLHELVMAHPSAPKKKTVPTKSTK